ncbi:hypothetical protein KAR91_41145 [Candidatus Pacearchaeota archaeon]|nr:hypothetical protein [Candidatus Pacearchaeota archaeon]
MGKLKNYTTTIPAVKSIGEIETILCEFGATNIMKKVEDKRFVSVMFSLDIGDKKNVPFKFTADIPKTAEYLYEEYASTRTRLTKEAEDFYDDAYKITWRIYKDLIHAQMSILKTGLFSLEQALLPFLMVDEHSTLADRFIEGKLDKLLPEYKSNG